MSPEEFELGAPIDEVTNVFNMGATAFCLLGGERDRSLAKWEDLRYSSLAEFYDAWVAAVVRLPDGNGQGINLE
jgi:serine/threonine-protein kinase